MNDPLEVRRDGSVVARLRRRRGGIACEYSEEILDTVPLGRPVLSCSLPVTPRPADATAWVRGLLPEGHEHALLLHELRELLLGLGLRLRVALGGLRLEQLIDLRAVLLELHRELFALRRIHHALEHFVELGL